MYNRPVFDDAITEEHSLRRLRAQLPRGLEALPLLRARPHPGCPRQGCPPARARSVGGSQEERQQTAQARGRSNHHRRRSAPAVPRASRERRSGRDPKEAPAPPGTEAFRRRGYRAEDAGYRDAADCNRAAAASIPGRRVEEASAATSSPASGRRTEERLGRRGLFVRLVIRRPPGARPHPTPS